MEFLPRRKYLIYICGIVNMGKMGSKMATETVPKKKVKKKKKLKAIAAPMHRLQVRDPGLVFDHATIKPKPDKAD